MVRISTTILHSLHLLAYGSFIFIFASIFYLRYPALSHAQETSRMGMHILTVHELSDAKAFLSTEQPDSWHYVTVPFTIEDIGRQAEWEAFFENAREQKVIPLVRLATRVEGDAWVVPNRKNVVDQIDFLSQFEWPTSQKHIIIFNEVNHAKEWGNTLDPIEYARTFEFASQWARSKDAGFVVLPAAMDLAAPNGRVTREAFTYLNQMREYNADIFSYADAWNSHSYPNPGFSAAPQRTGQNSLRGFEYELAYLKEVTNRDFQVYITETGWEDSPATRRWLRSYYTYALQHIWSHPQVVAVTPFIYKGAPGPFAGFSFMTAENQPTAQALALLQALRTTSGTPQLSQER
jgi:hypothetical protein